MQIKRVGYQIKGFGRITDYALRWAYMITEKAKHKARVLAFLEKHGIEATEEAFQVKRRTLYLWKSQLNQGGGKLESLNEKSKRPKSVRKRNWPDHILSEIRRLRKEHPNLGSQKIALLLKKVSSLEDIELPEARTIARIIADDPHKMRTFPVKVRHNGKIVPSKRVKRVRKPKHFISEYPGHCGAFDTVERFVHGCKRYILTFTDVYSRFSFALSTTSHGSKAAKDFFTIIAHVFPYPLTYVLTDNGSEFMKHFDEEIRRLHKEHWHTYPKTPKMNAHDERFNRTIQEEFVDYHEPLLLEPESFNEKLMDYLLWYNGERPHYGIQLQSPIQFLTKKDPHLCNMWWHDTFICKNRVHEL